MKNRILISLLLISFLAGIHIIAQSKEIKPKVTFVELGSVNCIPCKQMQPVMKAIEAKYGEQVKVIFYDVWTKEQKQYAQLYKIKLIPTQVFLDENGKEFHRHEGFYPEAEIDKLLQSKGLKVKKN
uniref:Thioredoxin n=1 Tax=Ignavibacterium album TaxID=591197 RepID=A0A832DMZ4_9BACT